MRASSEAFISETFCGTLRLGVVRVLVAGDFRGEGLTLSSTILFQAPHEGHLPSHFGESAPHSVQNQRVFSFVFAKCNDLDEIKNILKLDMSEFIVC